VGILSGQIQETSVTVIKTYVIKFRAFRENLIRAVGECKKKFTQNFPTFDDWKVSKSHSEISELSVET